MAKAKPQPKPQPRSHSPSTSGDPALDALTEGLSALQGKDWKKAAQHLEKAVELADRPELRDRARQFLAACRQKSGDGEAEQVDPFLQAVYEKNRVGGRDQKYDRFAYLGAAILAAEDRIEEAAQALAKAVELNSKNRIHAFHDPDFAELRKNRDYRPLFGLS